MSLGVGATAMPASFNAAILASAVPLPPDTMAPAWPMRRPGGAVVPAMKAAIAHFGGDAIWANVRPPLMNLPEDQTNKLLAELDRISFKIEGV